MHRSILALATMACAVSLLAATSSSAASFDCAKAATPREKLICSDKNLSSQDFQLAQAYDLARSHLSDAGRQALLVDQRAWLRLVAQTCMQSSPADKRRALWCLGHLYGDRIEDLRQSGVKTGPFTFTRRVEYQAVIPKKRDNTDVTGTAGAGISIFQSATPRIDEPLSPLTERWNALNTHHLDSESDCETSADRGLGYGITFANAQLISINWFNSTYCHDTPHGRSDMWGETWLLSPEPHLLQASDLFRNDLPWQTRLATLIEAAVRKAHTDAYKAEPHDLDMQPITDAAVNTRRWTISADGLQVMFNSYELGQGYGFAPTVTIPWSQLADVSVARLPILGP